MKVCILYNVLLNFVEIKFIIDYYVKNKVEKK